MAPTGAPGSFLLLVRGVSCLFPKASKMYRRCASSFWALAAPIPARRTPYDGTVCPTHQGTVMAVFRGSGHARFTAEGLPPLELDF